MDYIQGRFPIIQKENLAKDVYSLWIRCPELAGRAEPGQFVHILVEGFPLRRPISLCEIEPDRIRLVFQVRREGTRALGALREGDNLDLIGPLGKGFTLLPPSRKAVLIGGGLGAPPMLELARRYGADASVILGFRTAAAVILEEDFARTGAQMVLCTDDGSAGQKGFVTSALESQLEGVDLICACGPLPMLKGIAALAQERGIPCQVSLEERMGCGVGACLVCACRTVRDGQEIFSHVCKDGPVFDAETVVFE